MCGISTIFAYHEKAPDADLHELRAIRDAMRKRGPDGQGEWISSDRRIVMGHTRLSIIDLSENGTQPMISADGQTVITFNGEIYNYRELRRMLEVKGYIFKSRTDTEVILHLYAEKGERMFDDLRGMFAFALWDSQKKALLLARDPFGIKPLYYADDGRVIRAASQVKALLQSPFISKTIDTAGVTGFFLTGSVPEPFTWYENIRAVEAGTYVWVDGNGPGNATAYFSIRQSIDASELQENTENAETSEVIRKALIDSIKHHVVADVPVGIFLSSGIDSAVLAVLAGECQFKDVRAVTLTFDEFSGTANDELPLARQTAQRYGVQHTVYTLTQKEFREDIDLFLKNMDQPTIDGVNQYFVSKAASSTGLKVALSGLGADEIFSGYPSFKNIPLMVSVAGALSSLPFMKKIFSNISNTTAASLHLHPKFAGLLEFGNRYSGAYFLQRALFLPRELETILEKDFIDNGLRKLSMVDRMTASLPESVQEPQAKIMALETSFYMKNQLLRDADWTGMAHSLEIRTPFVDRSLFSALMPFLISRQNTEKKLLKKAFKSRLSQDQINRRKTGFTVPVNQWIQKEQTLDAWKKIHMLRHDRCPWARRWAYNVYESFNS